jgi:hypothetical protein
MRETGQVYSPVRYGENPLSDQLGSYSIEASVPDVRKSCCRLLRLPPWIPLWGQNTVRTTNDKLLLTRVDNLAVVGLGSEGLELVRGHYEVRQWIQGQGSAHRLR